jgi:hypothetical protein
LALTIFDALFLQAMVTYARECNISVETISVGADATASDEMLEAALEQLEGIGHKVYNPFARLCFPRQASAASSRAAALTRVVCV